jgi:hypothetical protein
MVFGILVAYRTSDSEIFVQDAERRLRHSGSVRSQRTMRSPKARFPSASADCRLTTSLGGLNPEGYLNSFRQAKANKQFTAIRQAYYYAQGHNPNAQLAGRLLRRSNRLDHSLTKGVTGDTSGGTGPGRSFATMVPLAWTRYRTSHYRSQSPSPRVPKPTNYLRCLAFSRPQPLKSGTTPLNIGFANPRATTCSIRRPGQADWGTYQ